MAYRSGISYSSSSHVSSTGFPYLHGFTDLVPAPFPHTTTGTGRPHPLLGFYPFPAGTPMYVCLA